MPKENEKNLTELFEEIAKPNDKGYSRAVSVEELISIDSRFAMGNGGSWCRSDGQLGKKYNIKRIKEKGKIVAVQLDGFNKQPKERAINKTIKKIINSQRCTVLDIGSNIECDHKNGKYNDRYMEDLSEQKIEDFQPLSKAVNVAKRQHCKKCNETGKRYDATRLGYVKPFINGDFDSKNCEGCYWHDPKLFNQTISKDYKGDFD